MKALTKFNLDVLIKITAGWHGVFAVVLAGLAVLLSRTAPPEQALWIRPVGVSLLILAALLSAVAIPYLLRRKPVGRILSVGVNYSGFLLALLACFQTLKIFLGIDFLAGTFSKGLLPLIGVLGGYLLNTLGDRYPHNYQKEQLFRRSGKGLMLLAALVFVWRTELLGWGFSTLREINTLLEVGLLVITAITGGLAWLMMQGAVGEGLPITTRQGEALSGYLFLSANLLGFLLFFALPLLLSLYVSFTNWDAFGTQDWVGLDNYATIFTLTFKPLASPTQPVTEAIDSTIYDELLRFTLLGRSFIVGAKDKLFWISLRNTLVFCLLAVPLSVIPALFLAAVLNSKIPGMKVFRVIYFLPSIAAVVGIALIWQWLYNATIGYINYAVTLGVNLLNQVLGAMWVDPQIRWLSDTKTALLAIIIMSAWQWLGFNSVLFLAGLQNIPGELYEAATVDGAGAWMRFWKITLPMLAPTTFFVVSTTVIKALQVFEQVYIATAPPGGGPNNATLVTVLYLYQTGFQRFKQGYASATAWVLFAVIFLLTLIQYQRQREAERAYE